MTILTGQVNIRKHLGISHNSEAELTVWSPKTCWLFPAPVIFVAIGLAIGLVDLQIMDEFCLLRVESDKAVLPKFFSSGWSAGLVVSKNQN